MSVFCYPPLRHCGFGTHIDGVAWVSIFERPGDGHARERCRSTTRHADLGTRDVELRDSSRVWIVDRELLNAEKVFARCNACRNLVAV